MASVACFTCSVLMAQCAHAHAPDMQLTHHSGTWKKSSMWRLVKKNPIAKLRQEDKTREEHTTLSVKSTDGTTADERICWHQGGQRHRTCSTKNYRNISRGSRSGRDFRSS